MQENKQEKSPIKQKILLYLSYIGMSQYDFYKKTGITRGILGQNNGISEENVSKFLVCFPDVSIEWLMTGRGNMLREEPPARAEKSTIIQNDPKDAEIIALLKDKIRLLEEKIASHSMGLDIARCADTLSIPGKKITHD